MHTKNTKSVLRILSGLSALLVSVGGLGAASASDKIAKVVVYPDRAQVTRTATLGCGEREVVRFAGLPPLAELGSVRAQVLDRNAQVLGLRTEEVVRESAYSKKLEELETEVHKLELEQRSLRDAEEREEGSQRLAHQYEEVSSTVIAREMATSKPEDQKAWTTALDSTLKTRLDTVAVLTQLRGKQRELSRRLSELRDQQRQLRGAAARRERVAEVVLSCARDGAPSRPVTLELSYLVRGAGFSPSHEARLLPDGGVEVLSYATLSQSTGEDWRAAALTVSTAVPRSDATPPEITPLRVYASEQRTPRRLLVSRSEDRPESTAAPQGQAAPVTVEPAPSGGKRPVEQGLSVQFLASTPADVLGDGTPARVLLSTTRLRGTLAYRAVPKLDPHVFRVVDLTNSASYPLLAGPVDVVTRGQFLGRYELRRVAAGARFTLSFGLVDRIKLRRQIVEEVARDRGVFGATRRHRYAYRFDVESYPETPSPSAAAAGVPPSPLVDEIELAEHVPVSELDDVKVAIDPKTTAGYAFDAADGIVSFRVRVRPGEKRTVDLAYFVDAPAALFGE